CQQQNTYPLTF
nr:immunoglobulin light chain junction region [Macaca mulatta]